MRKTVFVCIFFAAALSLYAQRIYTVGILPFEVSNEGLSDTANLGWQLADLATQITAQLNTCDTMIIREGDEAKSADYQIAGRLSSQTTGGATRPAAPAAGSAQASAQNGLVLTVNILEGRTGRIQNSFSEQAATMSAFSANTLSVRISGYIPYPAYYLGKWRANLDTSDGPVTCILEFRSDRTVRVEQYDTWEHNGTNCLKYQAIGTGTYSFTGHHFGRNVTVGSRLIQVNAIFGITLALEDALPKYISINRSNLGLLFNESRNSFELVSGGLPCGDNFTGPSVYPDASLFYTKFAKIQ